MIVDGDWIIIRINVAARARRGMIWRFDGVGRMVDTPIVSLYAMACLSEEVQTFCSDESRKPIIHGLFELGLSSHTKSVLSMRGNWQLLWV